MGNGEERRYPFFEVLGYGVVELDHFNDVLCDAMNRSRE